MQDWIRRKVRAAALRQLIAWALVLSGFLWWASTEQRYLYNFAFGPFDVGPAELAGIDVDETPRYFVRVSGPKSFPTGIQQIKITTSNGVETGREVTGEYYALVVGDRLLIIRSSKEGPTSAVGELKAMSGDLSEQLRQDKEINANWSRFYPLYVSDDSFRQSGYIATACFLGVVALLVWLGRKAWANFRDPDTHPAVTKLATWGEPATVPEEAARQLGEPRFRGGGWSVGDRYMVKSTIFSFDILRVEDLLWAYKKVTKHSVNFIPTGKTYAVMLLCFGGSAELSLSEAQTDQLLAFAAERAPWAIFGFSDEIAKAWAKNMPGFIATVQQNRQQWTASHKGAR